MVTFHEWLLTYDLSIRSQYGCVLPDWRPGRHQADSFPGRLGFDLRYDDVSTGEILGLTSTLSYEREERSE